MEGRILIIDDDRTILESLELLLKYHFGKVTCLANPNLILNTLDKDFYDVILLDMNFAAGRITGNEGLFWLKKILEFDINTVVILITAYGDIDLAVKGIKLGATDFIQKPWNAEKLISNMRTAYQLRRSKIKLLELEKDNSSLKENLDRYYPEFIGKSDAIIEVLKMTKKVARTDANVLILGENGTGKELIAREIHKQSRRSQRIFVSVDIASLNPSLVESELFGHVKGAFTDAQYDRTGRFEMACGGTLFLDEIGNLTVPSQAKLLTVIQNRNITRIGSNKSIPVDIRLISATNRDLTRLINDQLFREDLFYRINTVTINIPPLRERDEDLILLADYFLEMYRKKYDRPALKMSRKAYDSLKEYSWPGNVRELQHAIENAVILSDTDVLNQDNFRFNPFISPKVESFNLEMIEKDTILKALEKNKFRYSATASELGISRTTLYHKIKKYGIQ
jgi:DNA-binding NtrC family response regulator